MGGSVAAAAKARGRAREVWGVDPVHAQQAQESGFLDRAFHDLSSALDALAALNAQQTQHRAVLLAAPVSVLSQFLLPLSQHHIGQPWAWVTEIGSTKQAVVDAMRRILSHPDLSANQRQAFASIFVPSHPMAGAERSGPTAARPDLFQKARVLISPMAESSPEAVAEVEAFWIGLGGVPSLLPIEDHDPLLAAISHFPHLLAYALAGMLATGSSASAAQSLYGGGLRDTTRIAASAPELWADIFLQNRSALLELLPQWKLSLSEMVQAIEVEDRDALVSALDRAAQWRRRFD